jgi:hypothetical protein
MYTIWRHDLVHCKYSVHAVARRAHLRVHTVKVLFSCVAFATLSFFALKSADAQVRTRTILSQSLEKGTSIKIEANSDSTVTLHAIGIGNSFQLMILSPDSARALAGRLDSLLALPMKHDKGESIRADVELRDMNGRGTLMASRTLDDSKETLICTIVGPSGDLAMILPLRRAVATMSRSLDSAASIAGQMSKHR